jgi:hypothetical protein
VEIYPPLLKPDDTILHVEEERLPPICTPMSLLDGSHAIHTGLPLDASDINPSFSIPVGAERSGKEYSEFSSKFILNEGSESPNKGQLLYYSNIPLLPSSPPLSIPLNTSNLFIENNTAENLDSLSLREESSVQSSMEDDSLILAPETTPKSHSYRIRSLGSEEGAPSGLDHDHLRLYASELFESEATKAAKGKYELNWLSFPDLYNNKRLFDERSQYLLDLFLKSKWDDRVWLENGLKASNGTLAQAILLLIACEAWDKIPNADKIIESNLRKKNGLYSSRGGKRRFISPRAARTQILKFKNIYAPEELFRENFAYILLFESGEELRKIDDNASQRREEYERFFERNRQILQSWKKKKKISAFLLGHEISSLSIREQKFNPHSHAIVWVERHKDASFIKEEKENGVLIKNIERARKEYKEAEKFIGYMMRAHSLAATYKREFRNEDSVDFNNKTIRALRTLAELQCGDAGSKGKQKLYKEGIPTRQGKKRDDRAN